MSIHQMAFADDTGCAGNADALENLSVYMLSQTEKRHDAVISRTKACCCVYIGPLVWTRALHMSY